MINQYQVSFLKALALSILWMEDGPISLFAQNSVLFSIRLIMDSENVEFNRLFHYQPSL